jgi:hypothetical protein
MPAPKLDGAHLPQLLDDLDRALRDLTAPFERDPELWSREARGKWTPGQHVEHVGHVLAIGADALERAAEELRSGDLKPQPWRDPLQALFVLAVTRRFPSGGRAPSGSIPGAAPDRSRALERLEHVASRYHALAERLTIEQRDRLWIWNPYVPRLRWYYTFPELVRVQTTHAWHHLDSLRAASR